MNDVMIKDFDRKSLLRLILVMFLFFFGSLIQLIPINLFNMDIYNLTAMENVLLSTFSNSIVLAILIFIYRNDLKDDFNKVRKNFYKYVDCGIKYWLIGLIVMMISNIIIMTLFTQAIASNEEGVQSLISGSGYISLLTIGIISPMIEELTFRKSFHDLFKNKWVFIVVSSLVFGGLHVVLSLNSLWDLLYLIPYCSLGVSFGLMYTNSNNIFTSIMMHMFHNTVSTFLSILGAMILL